MIYLLLPAYNETAELGELFASVEGVLPALDEPLEIVLVDDGSTDGTADEARALSCKAKVTITSHEVNQGLGGALRTGFETILARRPAEDDVIVTMDTDNTHSPAYIPQMVQHLRREGLNLVVASRYAAGGQEVGVPALRRLLSRCASLFYGLLYRTPGISDYTCGYRAYRAGALRKAQEQFGKRLIEENGFPSTGEILLKIRSLGDRMGEIPFALHYEKKHTPSKMPLLATCLSTLRILMRYRFLTKNTKRA